MNKINYTSFYTWLKNIIKRYPYLILIAYCSCLFFAGISTIPVIERDEAHFAQATRQMLQTGNFFAIRFQEKTRFQKPPGINWLQAGLVSIFSTPNANAIWPYRLASSLGGIASVLLLFGFWRKAIGEKTAFLAAILLASTLLLVFEVHMAVIDGMLLMSVVLMQGALWQIYLRYKHNQASGFGWPLCFWLAMSLGFLLKGVTPLVGGLSLLVLIIIEGNNFLKYTKFWYGILLFIVCSLLWLYGVNQAEHTNYLMKLWHHDLLPKLKGGHESHGKPPLFHLIILPLTFWPASVFLKQGYNYLVKHFREPVVQFVMAWLVPSWIFFELMPTKLPQYVLPLFPAITLLCALGITSKEEEKNKSWLLFLQILWVVFSLILILVIPTVVLMLEKNISFIIILWSFISIALLSLIAKYSFKNSYLTVTTLLCGLSLWLYVGVFSWILPTLTPLWLSRDIATEVKKLGVSEKQPLFVLDYQEPGLVFYLNTYQVVFVDDKYMAMQKCMQNRGLLLMLEQPTNLPVIKKFHGYHYSKGQWMDVVLVGCYSHRGVIFK